MNPDDAEEYTQSLAQVVSGGWRQVALGKRLGVPQALGLSTREWVEERLGGYVKLNIAERREAVAELAAEDMTQREIADVLGTAKGTVHRDLSPAAPNGAVDESETPIPAAPETVLAPNGASEPVPLPVPEPEEPVPVPEPEPLPQLSERAKQDIERTNAEAQRESERRAGILNLRSVLIYLTSKAIKPAELAKTYADVLDEFDLNDLDFAAQTMTAIALLKES